MFPRLLSKLHAKSIRREIFMLFIGIVTIPFVVISGFTYFISLDAVKKEFQVSSELILNNLSFNFDQYLQGIEKATLTAFMDRQLQDAMNHLLAFPDAQNKLDIQRQIENFIASIESTIKHVNGVQLFTGNRVFYTGTYDLVGADYHYQYQEEDWYQKTIHSPNEKMLFGTHKPFQRKFSNDLVISFARVINDVKSGQYLGVLLIDIRLDSIREILALSENNKRKFIIIDEQGMIIYSSEDEDAVPTTMLNMEDEALQQILQTKKGNLFTPFAGNQVFVNFLTSNHSRWKVIQYVNEADMVQDSVRLGRMFIALAIGTIGIAVVFMLFISLRVSRPIIDLSKQVKLVGQGHFDVKLESKHENELGVLYRGLRKMIYDLQDYIDHVATAKLKLKEAQYGALKSQINPHFLSNTLESIQMQAVLNDQRSLAEMIGVLGRLFHIHTQTGKERALLSEELEHIRLYLKLQKMRHGDRLQVVEYIDPDCTELYVVHFMLQPIIENAISYGLEQQSSQVIITISAYIQESSLWVIIEDNGKGMTPEVLANIRHRLNQQIENPATDRIGLQNVHDRIRLSFGEQFGISIDSKLHQGTTVTMRLPIEATAKQQQA